jgi:hypothetical protein
VKDGYNPLVSAAWETAAGKEGARSKEARRPIRALLSCPELGHKKSPAGRVRGVRGQPGEFALCDAIAHRWSAVIMQTDCAPVMASSL